MGCQSRNGCQSTYLRSIFKVARYQGAIGHKSLKPKKSELSASPRIRNREGEVKLWGDRMWWVVLLTDMKDTMTAALGPFGCKISWAELSPMVLLRWFPRTGTHQHQEARYNMICGTIRSGTESNTHVRYHGSVRAGISRRIANGQQTPAKRGAHRKCDFGRSCKLSTLRLLDRWPSGEGRMRLWIKLTAPIEVRKPILGTLNVRSERLRDFGEAYGECFSHGSGKGYTIVMA